MKVICISDIFTGDPGPTPHWGEELTVKRIVSDRGDSLYRFKEYPEYGYEISGFLILESSLPRQRQRSAPKGGLF